MKISELIEVLKEKQNIHGDLECVCYNDDERYKLNCDKSDMYV